MKINKNILLVSLLIIFTSLIILGSVSAADSDDSNLTDDSLSLSDTDLTLDQADSSQTDEGNIEVSDSEQDTTDSDVVNAKSDTLTATADKKATATSSPTVVTNNVYINDGEVHTYDNYIFKNCVNDRGGAILLMRGTLVLDNCTFMNNEATGAAGSLAGGAIFINTDCKATINNCKFISNKASNGHGGAIVVYGDNVKITKCQFTNNYENTKSGTGFGGAIFWSGKNGEISGSTFTSNSAKTHGGAIEVRTQATNLKIDSCTFTKNKARSNDGGALSWGGKGGVITNTKFISNSANEEGGAMEAYTTPGTATTTVSISGCTFTSNTAKKAGGAIFTGKTVFTIKNSVFTKNTAGTTGGAVYNELKATISGNTFTSNSAKWGGAFYSQGKSATLSNNKMISNKDKSFGGAVYVNTGSVKSTGDVYYKNTAPTAGGAVCVMGGTKFTATGCYFIANKAPKYKVVFSKGKASLENNWWGNTLANKKVSPTKTKLTTAKVNKWLVLKVTTSKSKLYPGEEAKLTADLRFNNANKKITSQGSNIPLSFVVTNGKVASAKLNKGVGSTVFTKSNAKKSTVSCKVYDVKSKAVAISNAKKPTNLKTKLTVSAKDNSKEKAVITVTLKDNINKAVTGKAVSVKVNGKTYSGQTNSKGVATITTATLKGTFTVAANFAGGSGFVKSSASTKVTVKEISQPQPVINNTNTTPTNGTDTNSTPVNGTDTNSTPTNGTDTNNTPTNDTPVAKNAIINLISNNIKYGEMAILNVTVLDESNKGVNGFVNVTLDEVQQLQYELVNGSIAIPFENLSVGNHSITVILDNINYTAESKNINLIVSKASGANIALSIDNITEGQDANLNIIATVNNQNLSGEVTVTVGNNTPITGSIGQNGTIDIPLSGLTAGEYLISVEFTNENYETVTETTNLVVNPVNSGN